MATVQTAINYARTVALTDSNGLTNENGLTFINEAILDYRRKLITAGVDAAQLQEAYRDIDAGVGTYLYPTDMWWLKSIEVCYGNNASNQNYIRAIQADVSNLPANESPGWFRAMASPDRPFFDDRGDWFELLPTPTGDSTAGIRIFYYLEPPEYASVSDNISYPESLDYRILSYRVACSFYQSLNKFDDAMAYNNEYEKKVKDIIATLARGTQQPLQATTIPWTGWGL